MSKVLEIGICKVQASLIERTRSIKAISGKGLLNDRHFKENNTNRSQITLIEIENINQYNKKYNEKIPALSFRRNLVTEGIRLNELVGKFFFIGKVKVKGHDLCRPCKHLQDLLNKKNIIKEFLQKGGLRCEIISGGIISENDEIIC